MISVDLFIAGRSEAGVTYAERRDPGKLDDIVGRVAQATPQQAAAAIEAAHQAFSTWRAVPLAERSALMEQAAKVLDTAGDDIVTIMARESGMLPGINRGEIGLSANVVRDNIEHVQRFFDPELHEDATSFVSVEKRPVGVVSAIVPWNAPIILTMRKLAPALLCGNTIVVKPAPTAPIGVSLILERIARLFPAGVINVVHGGADVGTVLTTHPLVRVVSFTGGLKVAQQIMRDAAGTMKRVQFELGGNDPAIVLDDADLDLAIPRLAGSAFRRSGQFCFATKRIYVPTSLHDAFVERFLSEVGRFKVGHPLAEGTTFGPMNNEPQMRYVDGLVERAGLAGAKVHVLGEKLDPAGWDNGYYRMPVVVTDIAPDAELVVSEQFGPVLPIVRCDTEDAVVAMANQTELGLGSSVWSTSETRAMGLARRLEAGMTYINQGGSSRIGQKHIPFGGVKQSGIGRESGSAGLLEFVEHHAINLHRN